MSKLEELEKWDNHEELIFPCECANGDYLRIVWDEDPTWRCLWIEANAQKITFWQRIKGAWKILRNEAWQWSEIILTEESIKNLSEFLDSKKQ